MSRVEVTFRDAEDLCKRLARTALQFFRCSNHTSRYRKERFPLPIHLSG